jgi:hypothetical protein
MRSYSRLYLNRVHWRTWGLRCFCYKAGQRAVRDALAGRVKALRAGGCVGPVDRSAVAIAGAPRATAQIPIYGLKVVATPLQFLRYLIAAAGKIESYQALLAER